MERASDDSPVRARSPQPGCWARCEERESASDLYDFAYGSNLHPERLRERIGEVTLVSTGEVRRAELRFHEVGRDGSGKRVVVTAGGPSGAVFGAGYERSGVDVHPPARGVRRCHTYFALAGYVDRSVVPFSWYTALVALGSRSPVRGSLTRLSSQDRQALRARDVGFAPAPESDVSA